ncbi:MAG: polysaccharide biosynthesis tyrosine autokinase [Puia sp.]|nr:polysaccharide biosynthesis tyrosine autokinase [Puia sp.]
MAEQNQNSFADDLLKQQGNKPMGLREFVLRYLRYIPWVLLCVALSMVLGYFKIRYTVPTYKVEASLLIRNDAEEMGGKDAKLGQLFMSDNTKNLSNEIQILRSRPILERVSRDLDLSPHYYSKGKVRSSEQYKGEVLFRLEILKMSDSLNGFGFSITVLDEQQFTLNKQKQPYRFGQVFNIGNNLCMLVRNPGTAINYLQSREYVVNWLPPPVMADILHGGVKVTQGQEYATVLTLSMETENIAMGRDIINTLMAVYDSLIVEDKNRIADQTLRFIDDRLDTLRHELGGVQGGLKDFMEKNNAFDVTGLSTIYMNSIKETSKDLDDQEVKIRVLDFLYDYLNRSENQYKLVPTNLGIVDPTLTESVNGYNLLQLQRETNLKTTTPDNPMIQKMDLALDHLRRDMLQSLKNVRHAYEISKDYITKRGEQFKGELQSLPGKSMKEADITRNQHILEDLYTFLLQKKLETSISSASTISNSKVIEPALGSSQPVKPNHGSIYMTYLIIGLVIPIAIIAVIEMLSDKVNNRMEVEKATSVPILGEIGHSDDDQALIVTRNSRKFVAEQFRIIRTNLQYITGRNERPTILVTSSFSGEGKSFISTNIGAVMALTGKKTVIMEFDIRKPKILAGLDLKRKMGITNFIIGRSGFEDLPVPVEGIENLFVIPCGPIPPNPSELLLNPKLDELMRLVKENFDVVIMDTAPVGLVSDAINLSKFADCTLYIVRSGHTVRRLLGLVDELYTQKKLPGLSLLLNDVKLGGGYYGGYYGGYGYYGYGYGHEGGYFEKEEKGATSEFLARLKRFWNRWFV